MYKATKPLVKRGETWHPSSETVPDGAESVPSGTVFTRIDFATGEVRLIAKVEEKVVIVDGGEPDSAVYELIPQTETTVCPCFA